ncbi:hypothetical protein NNJEOMEG_00207 [Fundidesulfovibrio magnetotacticus]|uniref:Uncharacterized protein n=1 Tax=Fundidesulfovibrio magnetotacticus TaxID=2730080 RepID=A0A6V8LI21_9BACT|nr:hypothetical protein [Fundidesulfovibrio magnetotacticus]GFK92382.1 hypothetical protein NNJEOMEG_00207 [Fundidesulfovibrio magnetotacticus]
MQLKTAFAAIGLCLVFAAPGRVLAWDQVAQYGPYAPPPPHGYYHERERERDIRREERRRAREYQEWYDDQWRYRTQRYFGGQALTPRPGESYESFARRARVACNNQWNSCATYCNTIRDPNRRAACVANCNNELYECKSGF